MTTSQNWVPTDVDHAKKEYEDWEAGKTRTVKPPVGKSVWFILPARRGGSQGPTPFRKGQYVHFVRDPANVENVLAVGICPSKTRNEPCSVCPFLGRLRATGSPADKELGEKMAAKEHIICNAVRLDVDDPKVEILQLSSGVYGDLNKILRDKVEGVDFSNPTKGRAIIIERVGTGKTDTKYSCRLGAKEIALPKMAWLDEMSDLDNVFEELDMDGLKRTLAGDPPAPRPVSGSAPSGGEVTGSGEQKALPEQPSRAGAIDMVEDPITGEMVPRKK
jgi:hypothetical protein